MVTSSRHRLAAGWFLTLMPLTATLTVSSTSTASAATNTNTTTSTVLLPNGSDCSESAQCDSGCCVWDPLGDELCGDDGWLRSCVGDDHTFVDAASEELTDEDGKCGSALVSANAIATSDIAPSNSIRVLTYNVYLIILASDGPTSLDDRAQRIASYLASSEIANQYDIIALQETWLYPQIIRDGMIAAGYCHYAYDERGSTGSGLALYSRHPIAFHDFRGFQNACGGADCIFDKGVLYAQVNMTVSGKDEDGRDGAQSGSAEMVHVFNTHTMFSVDNHDVRQEQYGIMRTFIDEQNIDPSELVLLVGDFNEDKLNTPQMYGTMLELLGAGEFVFNQDGDGEVASYDPDNNSLIDPNSAGAGSTQRALDFVLYDQNALKPGPDSVCEYLQPKDEEGRDLSDHYPMSCMISRKDIVMDSTAAPLSASSDVKAETSGEVAVREHTRYAFLFGSMYCCLEFLLYVFA